MSKGEACLPGLRFQLVVTSYNACSENTDVLLVEKTIEDFAISGYRETNPKSMAKRLNSEISIRETGVRFNFNVSPRQYS